MGMVCTLKISPEGRTILKEPMWTVDVDYVTQNNMSS